MRRKRAAITSIHDKPPTRKEKLANFGGWVMLVVAVAVLLVGIYGLYQVMTDARVAELDVVGVRSDALPPCIPSGGCKWLGPYRCDAR